MSSPVHPGSIKPVDQEMCSGVTNARAWQEGNSRNSKTLGHFPPHKKAAFTGGFSSEDDSEDEERDLSIARGMTRSLGRKEMNRLTTSSRTNSNLISVSERSAAYKELISSSQNSWNVPKVSPKHSAMKLSSGSDTSPVQSKIELNPFFQLDKHGKIQTGSMSEEKRKTSPLHNNTLTCTKPKSPARAPATIGMSVQMRIKIWAEKEKGEEKTETDTKVMHRRSLQSASLLSVHSNTKNGELDVGKVERVTHSDDESAKNKNSPSDQPVRENLYDEIVDQTGRERIEEVSSSSDASPISSPSKTPKKTATKDKKIKKEKESPKLSKKKGKDKNPDSNAKHSKWKLRSPLPKRKNKIDQSQSAEENGKLSKSLKADKVSNKASHLSYSKKAKKSVNGEEASDNVFNSVEDNSQQQGTEHSDEEDQFEAVVSFKSDGLLSVFDRIDSSRSRTAGGNQRNQSFSHEVMNMIDAIGSTEETSPSPNNQGSNSDSDTGKYI